LQRTHADTRPACGLRSHDLWRSNADSDSDSDSYSNGDCNCHRYSYSYDFGYGKRYADSYCGTTSNSVTAAATNPGASPVGRSGSEKMISD